MDKIITYTSKDGDESSKVTIQQIGSVRVTEIESTSKLDAIAEEYNKSKDRAKRKQLKEEYKALAEQINKQFKQPVYNETL
jgi:predicted RNA-binding protein with PIN domain